MTNSPPDRRRDIRTALQRDLSRHARREVGHGSFWRALGVLGMVGWPIALAATGGALLGHYLDERWQTGVQFTLMLLTIATAVGSYAAWKSIGQQRS